MKPSLEGHMLAGRLKEDDKKLVHVKFEEKK
jgi:hypothetical protein